MLDYKYKVLNPLIAAFVTQEKKFIDSCAEFFRKFDNLSSKMSALDIAFRPTKIIYDPTNHIRATRLLVGVNINDLPQIIRKDKYGYEDYQKKIAEGNYSQSDNGGGNRNLNEYNKIMNMDKLGIDNLQNPFSYEAYKARLLTNTANKNDIQTPMNMSNDRFPQSNGQSMPQQQWNIKLNNINDSEQKHHEDLNVYNPYSTISLNSPNSIPSNNINPQIGFQHPYQSQMPFQHNNEFVKMNPQINNSNFMNYSNIPSQFNPPADFPR